MAARLNAAKKYVATHRPESLGWGPLEGVGPDLVEDIRRIKSHDGLDLLLMGSSTLISTLLEHGLADEVGCSSIQSYWARGSAFLQTVLRHAHSNSPAQTLRPQASLSIPTSPMGL
jgi:dihydrofolate reductase